MAAETSEDRATIRRLLDVVVSMPASVTEFSSEELDLAIRVARRVQLLGRLGVRLQSAGALDDLPPVVYDQLRSAIVMADSRARLSLWELDRIAWATESVQSIPLVAMKGCAYLLLDLPNTAGRVFADVDLMTSEDSLGKAEAILESNGWVSTELTPYDDNYYRQWTHELPPMIHRDREVEVDLHHNILPRTGRRKPSSAKFLEKSRPLHDSRYRVFADEDIVLHAMAHLMVDSDMADKLRELVDIHDLLVHFSGRNPEFWQLLTDRAVDMDLTRPIFYSIRYAASILGLAVPSWVADRTSQWAPPRIILSAMDRLVPRALYPTHPDRRNRTTELCRLFLYVRSHWIRMPPLLLARHLTYKFIAVRLRGGKPRDST